MKVLKRLMAMLTVACIAVSCLYIPASALDVSDASEGVVYIESSYGAGTGFCVGKAGEDPEFVVTNAHVVADDDGIFRDILVVFSGTANKFMVPEVYYIDPIVDICVLKLPEPTSERKPLTFSTTEDTGVGDTVYALGYPDYASAEQNYEAMDESDMTVTKGIVSKKTRINFRTQIGLDAIISDVMVSAGNSGGPLVNEDGAVVGLNTLVTTEEASQTESANGSISMATSYIFTALDAAGAPYEMYSAGGAAGDAADDTSVPTVTEETKSDNTTLIVIIAAAAVVVIAVVVAVVVASGKKKAPVPPAPVVPVTPVAPVTPAAPAAPEASVIGVSGILNGKKYKIGDRVIIGRNPDSCNICFPVNTKGISGVHCEIRKTGAKYEIMDCGSSYGTYLGSGEKLTPNSPVQITNGTYFYLGDPENRDQMFQFKI